MMIAVLVLVLGVLAGALFLILKNPNSGTVKKPKSNVNNDTKVPKMYTKAEVALHDKRTDCWIIIKDKVYDVTPYVFEHPGADAILNHAGDDSTEGFYGPQHATRVFDMVDEFYIGDLKL